MFTREDLKKRREDAGLSQAELAEKAGIDRSYYTLIEQGKRTPSFETAGRIAKVLGIEIDPEGIFARCES